MVVFFTKNCGQTLDPSHPKCYVPPKTSSSFRCLLLGERSFALMSFHTIIISHKNGEYKKKIYANNDLQVFIIRRVKYVRQFKVTLLSYHHRWLINGIILTLRYYCGRFEYNLSMWKRISTHSLIKTRPKDLAMRNEAAGVTGRTDICYRIQRWIASNSTSIYNYYI